MGFIIDHWDAEPQAEKPSREQSKAKPYNKRYNDNKKKLSPAPPSPQVVDGTGLLVATVVIGSEDVYTNDSRLNLMQDVIANVGDQADVLLFPAGFFEAKEEPSMFVKELTKKISLMIKRMKRNPIVCFGVDGGVFKVQKQSKEKRFSKDQLAVAIGKRGLLGLGRKFHPTNNEKEMIRTASDPLEGEDSFSRIVNISGKRAFLAVCYDSFGIRKRKLRNPGVDLILNLIHRFNPKGKGGSGDVYFAKHGLAGSSKHWCCPAFGSAVFFNRRIPNSWPSGVMWNMGNTSTKNWKYKKNALHPLHNLEISRGPEKANIKIYQI